MRVPIFSLRVALLMATLTPLACSAEGEATSLDEGDQDAAGGSGGGGLDLGNDGSGGATPPLIVPGETEKRTFRSPVVTGDYLWSPNPTSGKVALIDATTLTTRVLTAGLEPTHVAALPAGAQESTASAIILNVGTSDASFFRVTGDSVETKVIDVHAGANQWAISESGRYAVAWSFAEGETLDPTNGLQEVSVIDLSDSEPKSRRLTVGFRPSQIAFDQDEDHLIAVCHLGISVVDLEGDGSAFLSLPSADGRDVSITKAGSHALVRREDQSSIDIMALDESGATLKLTLEAPVSDLDLSPTGRAVAVLRQTSTLVTFMIDEILDDPTAFETLTLADQVVGSAELTADGNTVVLFTNATDNRFVTVVELTEGTAFLEHATFDAQSPVESVKVSQSGDHAVVIAKGVEGSNAGSFAVLSLREARFPRIVGTKAPILDVDLDDEIAVVTASNETTHEAHLVSLRELMTDPVTLSSEPISAGVLPGLLTGFAAQDHPEGRVTFFELASGRVRTLTGFELSSEIVQK